MLRKTLTLTFMSMVVIAVLAVGTAVAAKVSVNIKGGSLVLTPSGDSSLTDVTLDGTDQATTGALAQLRVRDGRGTGVGWSLTVSATDFEEINDPSKTIAATGFSVSAVNMVREAGSPSGSVTQNTGALSPPLTLMSAASPGGRGSYRAVPDLSLSVPAETFVGTYASTVTETVL